MSDQPVQCAEPPPAEPDSRWDSRIPLGRALRLVALTVPLFLCVSFALLLIAVLPAPSDSGQSVGWWLTVGFAVVVVAISSDRALERIAPAVPLPVLALHWPHLVIVMLGVTAGVAAALTIPGGTPELIAYANLSTAEDTDLSVPIGEGNPPDELTILSVVGPATARWTGTDIVISGEPNANGDVLVTYRACWNGDCAEGQLFATFTPVNDAPIAAVDLMEATSTGPITVQPLVNDIDLDQDSLQLESAEVLAGRATVEVAGNDLVVTPDDDKPQTIDLSYIVYDGAGGRGEGSAQIIVPDFNEAPIAIEDLATVVAGKMVESNVLENDSDPDGDPLRLKAATLTDPSTGTVEVVDDTIRFTAAMVTATAQVQYEVSDGDRASFGLLVITIVPPPPQPADDQATTDEDTSIRFNVIDNDRAPASSIDAKTLRVLSSSLGQATAGDDGSIEFVPEPDAYGIGSVNYRVCNLSAMCATASAEVHIDRVNDAPTFEPGSDVLARSGQIFSRQWATELSVGENNEPTQTVTFIVTAADPSLFATPPSIDRNGVLRFNAGSTVGTTEITVVATDGQDESAPATFLVSIS